MYIYSRPLLSRPIKCAIIYLSILFYSKLREKLEASTAIQYLTTIQKFMAVCKRGSVREAMAVPNLAMYMQALESRNVGHSGLSKHSQQLGYCAKLLAANEDVPATKKR